MGNVYLVGAGPGDKGLITVKGLEYLRECDAVVYDRLATPELLEVVKPDCETIYVGKKAGEHYKKQDEINAILVECGKKYKKTVRLKGGDPFVFGRAVEEMEALEAAGISYEVVPGITSAISVPELAGIPVTKREVSRSFHVITGHTVTENGVAEYDFNTLAKLEGTLVFLMGLSNLSMIALSLIAAGKSMDTPAAVISNGATPLQQTVRGTLASISEQVKEEQLPSPAIIVIGPTAGDQYRSKKSRKKVGVVATDLLWKKCKAALEAIQWQPVRLMNMNIKKTKSYDTMPLDWLPQYQWLVFTSQNGIRLFWDAMLEQQIDIRQLSNVKFAVIGKGTADKLLEYGIRADFVPSKYNVDTFKVEFSDVVRPEDHVLLLRAKQGDPTLKETIAAKVAGCEEYLIYDVCGEKTVQFEQVPDMDILVFVSASGVNAFFEQLQLSNVEISNHCKIACIGEVTKRRLLAYQQNADIVASVNDVAGLVEAIQQV